MMNEVADWENYSDLKLDQNRYEFSPPLALMLFYVDSQTCNVYSFVCQI